MRVRLAPLVIGHLCVLAWGLLGCDGPTGVDGGPQVDAGPPDAGPPLACTDLTPLEAEVGGTVSVMFDTVMTETRPRDLGLACGNIESELRWAKQEVVALHIPDGAGQVEVAMSTLFDETTPEFDTLLQVRSSCETAPSGRFPTTCFDNFSATDYRAGGSFTANGGDTVFVLVTGYSEPPAEALTVDEGRVRVDFTVRANTAPTVTGGEFLLALDDVIVLARGTDAEANARGVALNFFGPSGELLDIFGDGEASADDDVFLVTFDPAPDTTDYDAQGTVLGAQVTLADYLRSVGATAVEMRVIDEADAASAPLRVDITEAELVGVDGDCAATSPCWPELTCSSGTCSLEGPATGACSDAIALNLQSPTDTRTTVTLAGRSGPGEGLFAPDLDCVAGQVQATIGGEAIYSFTVAEDTTVDLTASTSGDTDTVMYLRSSCGDRSTELACNDDIEQSNTLSEFEVADLGPGTYFLFIEAYGGRASGQAPHTVAVALLPVLATGAACDDAGVDNRCAAGACAASVCP